LTSLRVCLVVETYHPVIGGGETQARTVAAGLGAHGIRTWVITRRSDAAFARAESIDDVPVLRLGPAGPGHLKKWAMLPGLLATLLRRRRDWDVVLVSGYRVLGIAAVPAARLLGKRVVLKADNDGEMSGSYFQGGAAKLGLAGKGRLVAAIVAVRNVLLRRADAFVALSSGMRGELEAHGVRPERITDIPNSVDTARFRPVAPAERTALRARLGLPAEGPIVVFAGRLLAGKGVMDLARSWAELAPAFPEATLVIVGSGKGLMHDCEAELHAFIAARGLGPRVVTTGFVTNVEAYLQAADIFAFPTTDEAFGLALVEAMATGLAAVAARVGGIRDIVEPGVNGLLIEPRDQPALTAALRRLLADPALRRELGEAATATVAARYTNAAVLAGYATLFNGLVRQRSAARPADVRPEAERDRA
jgi:glycosyltransferase involved in cell wall biosynthesis